MMKMTVIDFMNEIADKQIALDNSEAGEERDKAVADAEITVKMSKNFFIGADLVVRTEQLQAKNKSLSFSQLKKVIGEA